MAGRAQFRPGAKVERIQKRLDSPTAALKIAGLLMVAASQRAFRQQGLGKEKWEPRAPINVFGLIADFARGAGAPAQRRFQRRPALMDTGRLSSSISSKIVSDATVEVGTVVEYASVHQKGGQVESETITEGMQRAIWEWLKTKGRRYKRDLGWLLNRKWRGKKLQSEVPARPFIGLTDQTQAEVMRATGRQIMEAN